MTYPMFSVNDDKAEVFAAAGPGDDAETGTSRRYHDFYDNTIGLHYKSDIDESPSTRLVANGLCAVSSLIND